MRFWYISQGRAVKAQTSLICLHTQRRDVDEGSGLKCMPLAIETASANSVESDLGCTSRIYFDNVTMTLHNVTLTSQTPCERNNKCDCSKTNGYK